MKHNAKRARPTKRKTRPKDAKGCEDVPMHVQNKGSLDKQVWQIDSDSDESVGDMAGGCAQPDKSFDEAAWVLPFSSMRAFVCPSGRGCEPAGL